MKMKLVDIAKKLDISVAAVSMALNAKKGVSDETRALVMQTAMEMGYKIKSSQCSNEDSAHKKYLQLIRLKKHGLVATDTAFFAEVVEGIEAAAKKAGYQLLISNFYVNELDKDAYELVDYDNADGVIIFATELGSEDVAFMRRINKKIVILDNFFVDHGWDAILMNNHGAAFQAIDHFYKKGHKRIGYLRSNTSMYNFEKRYQGYEESMKSMNLDINSDYILSLEPTLAGAQRDMSVLLEKMDLNVLPTAFLADNDIIAAGAINAMKMSGIRVPQDVSVIGIDDMPFCQMMESKLTTIRIFKHEMGQEAVELLQKIKNHDGHYTQKIEINTELVERESVKDLS